FGQVRQELLPGRGRDVDRQRPLAKLFLVLDVEVTLPVADQLDGYSALASLVIEVQGARERGVDADHPPFQHFVEVAVPRLVCDSELAVLRALRRGGFTGGSLLGRALCKRQPRPRKRQCSDQANETEFHGQGSFHLSRKRELLPV